MKSPKGFRGKYFSLAAILALNATVTLASEGQSVVDTEKQLYAPKAESSSETSAVLEETSAPVVVISKKIKLSEVGAPFASEIYTKKEIEKSHSKDIYEFLNTQTSISTLPVYGNPFSQKVDMRGYGLGDGYQNTVISVNGRRLNTIDMVPQLLSSIPLDSIEKVEIIKGSGSVEYGDGANAGVINIITKDYEGAVIRSYMGDNGLKFGSLGLGIKEDKFSISGYIDDYSHDGFKDVANDGTKDESWSRNKVISATWTPIDDLTLNVSKSFSKMNVNYSNSLSYAEYKNGELDKIKGYTEQYFSSNVLSVGANYKINQKFSLDAQFFDEDKVSKFVSYGSKSTYDYKSFDTKLLYSNTSLKALVGVQGFDGKRDGGSNTTSKENLGVYARADYLFNQHTFSTGMREEKVNYEYKSATQELESDTSLQAYDVGYNYKINAKTSFFTNFNHSYQAPDVDRFFNMGGTFNGFIKPMEADTINLGFNYMRYPHTFKTTLFYAWVDDEIYFNPITYKNTNLKETEKRGFELSERYQMLSNLFTILNYTYVDTKIVDDGYGGVYNGKEIPGVSPHTLKVSLGYNPIKAVTLLLSETYKSRAYAIDNFSGSYGKMESYSVTDVSATYTYKNYEVYAKINNLFNEKNAMFIDFGGATPSVYPINYERTFLVGFSAKF
ncbi:TonB-dependent receptor [Sulfurospirillum barnesii]|uniref:Outer membrane receptor protein n=1 Tax=Sulfurospirillum barnesii (strain ATCC 700032 / DSM 10660 / SES-3) TaxID=760154 RepID=I3XXY3_SULBS|nr:TonB-dependent receptor [Sulfurospirillum barnesii]AFL68807.1 outer membrane receptor protein [Sulfurospirillum barnesii SES-3]